MAKNQKRPVRAVALALALVSLPAFADHPHISEDADVLGKGLWQIQLHGERARDREAGSTTRTTETELHLTYGVRDDADVQVGVPYLREVTDGAVIEGRGDVSVAYKWRLHEAARGRVLVKPAVTLPTGRDELGLGSGRISWSLDLVGLYEASERLELLGNLRYERNRNRIGEREPIWHVSAAVLFQLTEPLKLMVDFAQETNRDASARSPIREVAYGGIYELSKLVELGLALKRGLNAPADDRSVLFALRLRY